MVEYSVNLNAVFQALADETRRDILKRVSKTTLTISELAGPYKMSFAGIAKHITKLQAAGLITKQKVGKQQIVSVAPEGLVAASAHLEQYKKIWEPRFDALDNLLK